MLGQNKPESKREFKPEPQPEHLSDEKKLANLEADLTKLSTDIRETIGRSHKINKVNHKYLNHYENQETAIKLKRISSETVEELDEKFIRFDSQEQNAVLGRVQNIFRDLDAKLNNQFTTLIETGDAYTFQNRVDLVNAAQEQFEVECKNLEKFYREEFENSQEYQIALGGIALAEETKKNDLKKEDEKTHIIPSNEIERLQMMLEEKQSQVKRAEKKILEPEVKNEFQPTPDVLKSQLNVARAEERQAKADLDKFMQRYEAGVVEAKGKLKNLEQGLNSRIADLDKFKKSKMKELEHFKNADEYQKEINKLKQSVADQHHVAASNAYRLERKVDHRWIHVETLKEMAEKKQASIDPDISISEDELSGRKLGKYSKVGYGWSVVVNKDGTITTSPLLDTKEATVKEIEANYAVRMDFLAETGTKTMFIKYKDLKMMDLNTVEFLCKGAWTRGMTVDLEDIRANIDTMSPPLPPNAKAHFMSLYNKNQVKISERNPKDLADQKAAETFREDAKLHNKTEALKSNKDNRIANKFELDANWHPSGDIMKLPSGPVDETKIEKGKLYIHEKEDGTGLEFYHRIGSNEVKCSDLAKDVKFDPPLTAVSKLDDLTDNHLATIGMSNFFAALSDAKIKDGYLASVEAKAQNSFDKLKHYKAESEKLTSQANRLGEGINVLETQITKVYNEMKTIEDKKDHDGTDKYAMDQLRNKYVRLKEKLSDLRKEAATELNDIQTKRDALRDGVADLKFDGDHKEKGRIRKSKLHDELKDFEIVDPNTNTKKKLDDVAATLSDLSKKMEEFDYKHAAILKNVETEIERKRLNP